MSISSTTDDQRSTKIKRRFRLHPHEIIISSVHKKAPVITLRTALQVICSLVVLLPFVLTATKDSAFLSYRQQLTCSTTTSTPAPSLLVEAGFVQTAYHRFHNHHHHHHKVNTKTKTKPDQKQDQQSNLFFIKLATADQFGPSYPNKHKKTIMNDSSIDSKNISANTESSSSPVSPSKQVSSDNDHENEKSDTEIDYNNNDADADADDAINPNDLTMLTANEDIDLDSTMSIDDDDDDDNEDDLSFGESTSFEDALDTKEDSDTTILTHYIFLVHGWLGDSSEMDYVEEAILKAQSNVESPQHRIVVHSVTSNNGRTSDGIATGGIRIAEEIQKFISHDVQMFANINTGTDPNSTTSSLRFSSSSSASSVKTTNISISFIGNSLGGLYARYALSCIPQQFHIASMTIKLHYNIFCTTVTPHLGVASNTFLRLPRFMEHVIGNVLLSTGRDLFRVDTNPDSGRSRTDSSGEDAVMNRHDTTSPSDSDDQSHHQVNDLIYKMSVDDNFLAPLLKFRKRIAYINAFGSDFQVPTSTAAFLDEESTYPHHVLDMEQSNHGDGDGDRPSFITAVLITEQNLDFINANDDWYRNKSPHLIMSNKLDALGWNKVFIDTRDRIPLPSFTFRSLFGGEKKKTHKEIWDDFVKSKEDQRCLKNSDGFNVVATVESKDMYRLLTCNDRVQVPAGHGVLVANSKSESYKKFSSQGRPVMDNLARDMIHEIMDS